MKKLIVSFFAFSGLYAAEITPQFNTNDPQNNCDISEIPTNTNVVSVDHLQNQAGRLEGFVEKAGSDAEIQDERLRDSVKKAEIDAKIQAECLAGFGKKAKSDAENVVGKFGRWVNRI